MNIKDHFTDLNIDVKKLTAKKQQTTKKIEYVREYVKGWSIVSAERDAIEMINFIDCMSNAGVYKDGDCCTAIEVLLIFKDMCSSYPNKKFQVFCNDYDPKAIEILKTVAAFVCPVMPKNLFIYSTIKDVNDYLSFLDRNEINAGNRIFGYGASTVVFVDPFDFGTVEIARMSSLLQHHYCELIFNLFVSDYTRNIRQDAGRISKCIGGRNITSKEELISYIQDQLRVGKIEYSFAYQFRTEKNVELYQIVFATPNIRGLEVLKEALWKVFNGAEYHRNKIETGQISFFTEDDEREESLHRYAAEGRNMISSYFAGKEESYDDIESFLIENTMLNKSHIIRYVLKPMIETGAIQKLGLVRANNYSKDHYRIRNREISQ